MLTEAQVKLAIDAMFGVIESKEKGLALVLTKAVQQIADANVPLITEAINAKLFWQTPPTA